MVLRFDPYELARFQLAKDREATARFPVLYQRKIARMIASPFAFLRGAAKLFYELLRQSPKLAEGPGGSGLIVGDLHLENFGAYRPAEPVFDDGAPRSAQSYAATFGLNDFDDATRGPWRFDLLRLVTSLILGGREMGATGTEVLLMAEALLDAWNEHAHAKAPKKPPLRHRPSAPSCTRSRHVPGESSSTLGPSGPTGVAASCAGLATSVSRRRWRRRCQGRSLATSRASTRVSSPRLIVSASSTRPSGSRGQAALALSASRCSSPARVALTEAGSST